MLSLRALGIFGSEYELSDNLTTHQWTLLENTLSALALASDVIPAVAVLLRLLTKETEVTFK